MSRGKKAGSDAGGEPVESFEVSLEELETIVSQLESGAKPLEESLKLYEQGIAALRKCHGILDKAEKRIKILVKGAQGVPVLGESDRFGEEENPKGTVNSETAGGQKTTGQGIDSGSGRGQNPESSTTKPGSKGGSKAGGGSLFGSA